MLKTIGFLSFLIFGQAALAKTVLVEHCSVGADSEVYLSSEGQTERQENRPLDAKIFEDERGLFAQIKYTDTGELVVDQIPVMAGPKEDSQEYASLSGRKMKRTDSLTLSVISLKPNSKRPTGQVAFLHYLRYGSNLSISIQIDGQRLNCDNL